MKRYDNKWVRGEGSSIVPRKKKWRHDNKCPRGEAFACQNDSDWYKLFISECFYGTFIGNFSTTSCLGYENPINLFFSLSYNQHDLIATIMLCCFFWCLEKESQYSGKSYYNIFVFQGCQRGPSTSHGIRFDCCPTCIITSYCGD